MTKRKFDFNKDRMGLLAGLVEDDLIQETKFQLAEDEYTNLLEDDVSEVDRTLQEYMGYKPEDSDGEEGVDCECPEKARPPEEAGLPGWSYYDADPTHAKIKTMDKDLQHKKELQWYPPLESELEEIDEANESTVRSKINSMISDHNDIHGSLEMEDLNEHDIKHGSLFGPGFGKMKEDATWGVDESNLAEMGGWKEHVDLPGEIEDRSMGDESTLPPHMRTAIEDMRAGLHDRVHSSHVRELLQRPEWSELAPTLTPAIDAYREWYQSHYGQPALIESDEPEDRFESGHDSCDMCANPEAAVEDEGLNYCEDCWDEKQREDEGW